MDEVKEVDKRESIRVITSNDLIKAEGIAKLSLNARKLFYIAVSQCKRSDKEFYTYEISPTELAEMWGVNRQDVYMTAKKTCIELMTLLLDLSKKEKGFKLRHLFELCDYDDNKMLMFKLHADMTDLLLGLNGGFSKPLLWDFMRMRSRYSIAIWHLMQKEMRSFKPMMSAPIMFDLTLDDLRKVTGTEKKLKQISEFKSRVLDKALVEIKRNCWVDIKYDNIKQGRTVVGFRFTAQNVMGTMKIEDMPYRMQKQVRKAMLVRKKADGLITPDEYDELQALILELEQITWEDYINGYVE
jgi:plasmid replication initiation protein